MTVEVVAGCEGLSLVGGSSGVLVLHGFTGNPASLRSIALRCGGAGFSVELPRLPGHGTSVEDMTKTGWDDWANCAESAYRDLAGRCERVALIGLSMGGGLAAYLLERYSEITAAVLINPLVKPPAPELLEGLDQLLVAGIEQMESIGSDIKKPGTTEASYDATPLAPAKSLFEAIIGVHDKLSKITSPVLLLSSREDHVVTSDNGDDLVVTSSGPVERVWLENSYHVATMDNDQELVESLSLDFLKGFL